MIFQSIKMAWNSIASNKMRSFLTMLGIIIGVASLIVLVSIADGATGSVTDTISSMGTNLLTVSIQDDKENPLRLSELSDFVDEETIRMAAPYAQTSVTAKSGYTSDTMTVYGTTGAYYDIQGLSLQNGRWMNKADVDKISQAFAKMMQEDLTMKAVNDSANHQTLLYGMGDQHIDIIVSKLLERYKVEVELSRPKVAFRETIRKNSDVEAKYKKQSGGHGQYGHVKMRFSASGDLEKPYVFEQEVVGGAVPKNYFPAVEKGIQEAVQKGPLAAYPVVGVKAVLYDGSYHPVDSSEMAFKTAAIQAFKKGFMEASPVLLEPIVSMKITVDDKYTGDIMGDLNKRRGRVLGMNPDHKGHTIIEADVPELEIYGYGTTLRSMTGGSGDFSYEFARYEQAPSDIQAKEIEARASKVEKAEE